MITLNLEEQQLKDIFKQALLEIFEERQDLAESLFQETLEDWGLLHAIREGETTNTVTRDSMNVTFKNSFVKDLQRIKERALGIRVKEVIASIEQAATLQEITSLKSLKGSAGYYRIRIGDYRIGLRVEGESVTLVRFLHRKEVYRYFP